MLPCSTMEDIPYSRGEHSPRRRLGPSTFAAALAAGLPGPSAAENTLGSGPALGDSGAGTWVLSARLASASDLLLAGRFAASHQGQVGKCPAPGFTSPD